MKKYLFFVALLFTVTFAVNAANILVWNFNPDNYDEFTDPEVGQKINCGYWLKEGLTNNGYTFTYHDNTKLPADISSYDIIVGTVGYYECWGDHSKIDPADQTKLVNFLNSRGKGLYIEGNDLGYANKGTAFYNMLGANYDDDGDKISSLSGQNGSIVEGKSYSFIQNLSINTYMDEISSNGGTMIFQCNTNKGRAVTYEGQNNTYKVIFSTFVFGGIRTEQAKNELMKIYMDYLLGTGDQQAPVVSVTSPSAGEELQQGATHSIEWTATDNVGVVSRAIYFTDDDGSTWTLVDSTGSNTGTFDWTVPTTTSALCMIKVFAYDAAGNVGANESAQFVIGGTGIIPNVFTIKPAGTYKVTITNVQGRVISSFMTKNLDLKQIRESLPSGLHIVHIMTSRERISKKFLLVR